MTLHILNKTSSATELNEQLSNAIRKEDYVLLIEDGAYQCLSLSSAPWATDVAAIYVLDEDARARGIEIPEGIEQIDYRGFLNLSLEHNKVLSWY